MTRKAKSFIAYDFDMQLVMRAPSRRAAQKLVNAGTGRIAGVGWSETLLRAAGVEVRVSEKAEFAGRELFAIVFEDFPLARTTVEEAFGLDFVDWDATDAENGA